MHVTMKDSIHNCKSGYLLSSDFFKGSELCLLEERIIQLASIYKSNEEDFLAILRRLSQESPLSFYKIFFAASRSLEMEQIKKKCFQHLELSIPGRKYINFEAAICCSLVSNKWTNIEWHQSQAIFPDTRNVVTFLFPIFGHESSWINFRWNNQFLDNAMVHRSTNFPVNFSSQLRFDGDDNTLNERSFTIDFKKGDLLTTNPNLFMNLDLKGSSAPVVIFGIVRSVSLEDLPPHLNSRVYVCGESNANSPNRSS